jgi:hypothetical protein
MYLGSANSCIISVVNTGKQKSGSVAFVRACKKKICVYKALAADK